jgi:rhodanese-related sulfurtransferase
MARPQSLETHPSRHYIERGELLARLHDRALAIVNVQPAESFKSGHIPGSVSLPVADIEAKSGHILSNRSQEIAIYCAGPT